MRFESLVFIFFTASVSAQKVVGTAYGFAKGTTGGGSAAAVTPTNGDDLAKLLSDDVARVIVIDKEFDFTGKTATGAGCDKSTCKASNGGQFYLGDLSCGGSDMTAVSSVKYDTAGTTPLVVGSNKSIVGVGAKGVIKGKGLQLKSGAKNIIIQGIHITNINPGVVWGGDALDFKGSNDGVWVDHCKFSLTGRMFVVSHYTGSRFTLSNNEFDGNTQTSGTCNNNHYWGLMFIANNDRVTLHQNYFHNQSGRAPKLGQDGVSGTFHAVNNYFENMKGHAFDAYKGANALVEGNAFKAVSQPSTPAAAGVSTFVVNAGSACSSGLGRVCVANSVDSASGKLTGGSTTSFLSNIKSYDVTPIDASKVAAKVLANAGPSKLSASSSNSNSTKPVTAEEKGKEVVTPPAASPAPAPSPPAQNAGATGSAQLYAQCGGQGYSGPTKCVAGATCVKSNEWYSQCLASSKFRRQVV